MLDSLDSHTILYTSTSLGMGRVIKHTIYFMNIYYRTKFRW